MSSNDTDNDGISEATDNDNIIQEDEIGWIFKLNWNVLILKTNYTSEEALPRKTLPELWECKMKQ